MQLQIEQHSKYLASMMGAPPPPPPCTPGLGLGIGLGLGLGLGLKIRKRTTHSSLTPPSSGYALLLWRLLALRGLSGRLLG